MKKNNVFKIKDLYKKKSAPKPRKKNYEKRKSEIQKIAKKVTSEFNSYLKSSSNKENLTNETLENMIIMGDLIKEEILIEKKENPEKFIDIDKNLTDEKNENFAICLLAKYLENNGIITAVEKKADNQNSDIDAANLQFIINGLAYENKLDVHFDYGKKKMKKY